MHDALAAEHRTRYAMQSAQWARDNAEPPEADPDADPRDLIDDLSRNPAKVNDWLSDVADAKYAPDREMSFAEIDAVLAFEAGAKVEALMTALIGGTEAQAVKAMWLLRKSFEAWAEDRIQPEGV